MCNTDNMEVLLRKSVYSFIRKLEDRSNSVIMTLMNS